MKFRVRFLSSLLIVALAIFMVMPAIANAQVSPATMSHDGQDDGGDDECVIEIMTAVMEVTGIEDEDELIAYVDELSDEEAQALLEEAGVAELAETCDLGMDEEVSCEELAYEMLAIVTEIEDEEELATYLESLDEEELNALYDDAAELLVLAALSEATGIEDEDELNAYLEGLDEEELNALFEEAGINEIEDACADDVNIEDLPEECLVEIFDVLVEATGIEDEEEMLTYLDELDEEELDALLDENGIYDIIDACDMGDTEADAS